MILKPIKIKTDVSPKQLKPEEAIFILNQSRNLDGLGKLNDWFANQKIADITTPQGNTFCVGGYYHERTKDLYTWHWNENNNDFILRYRDGKHELVYQGDLGLEIDPRNVVTQFRAFVVYDQNLDFGKFLMWTNGIGDIHYLDVELSLVTNGFRHPYFSGCFADPKYFHWLDAFQPLDCITAELDFNSVDLTKTNRLLDKPWQWRYKGIYYDGRESEWSPISTTYFVDIQKCFSGTAPRCYNLRIPVMNPFVVKYVLAFRNDNTNNWFEYDVINRFEEGGPGLWYEQPQAIELDSVNPCYFNYRFCGDKRCDPIAPTETQRILNPKPRNVQTLVPIDNRIAAINYERGNDGLPTKEKQKIVFETAPGDSDCSIEYAEVKVGVVVHTPVHDRNQPLYQMDGTEDGTVFFGGILPALDGGHETGYDQFFNGDTRNFIAYVDGTEYFIELEQHLYKTRWGQSQAEKVGILTDLSDKGEVNAVRRRTRGGQYYIQIGTMKVPKGMKGFIRIANHKATGNEQNTSATVGGIWLGTTPYRGNVGLNSGLIGTPNIDRTITELYFDTCNGDVDLTNRPFVVFDMAFDKGADGKSTAVYGYLRDKNGTALENVRITTSNANFFSRTTDHNGFYFVSFDNARGIAQFFAETDCSDFTKIAEVPQSTGEKGASTEFQPEVEDVALRTHFVRVPIFDCTGVPLQGVTVAMAGSKSVVSDATGNAVLTARNVHTRNRRSRVVVMQGSECLLRDCDGGCNPCMPDFTVTFPVCFNGEETLLGQQVFSAFNLRQKFLKPGGRYEFGIVMHGNGRTSFTQTNDWILPIPTYQEIGQIRFTDVFANIAPGIQWPDWVTHVAFARTRNLNYNRYLQWVVDEIEFINSEGRITNPESSAFARITIKSLNDYNEKYFFKTNTEYQFSPDDRVEFITSKPGTLFDRVVNIRLASPFNTNKETDLETKFFNQILVPFSRDLLEVEEGATIELQKPFDCENKAVFQEICSPIPIQFFTGRLKINSFDTYRVQRFMNGVLQSVDHDAITDIWGRVDDAGRLYTANVFERSTHIPRGIILSGAYSIFGTRNSISFFDEAQSKIFQGWEQGDIIGAHINDASLLFVVCENNFFVSFVGDDFVRTSPDGTIRTNPSDQIVSNPQPKRGLAVGCSYNEIGSIFFGNGFVTWWDCKQGIWAFSNYQEAVDVGNDQIAKGFKQICEYIFSNNATAAPIDKVRVWSGWDPLSEFVLFTVKKILQPEVFNQYEAPRFDQNQTIAFDPMEKDFPTVLSFTPDALFNIENNKFISYFKSQPWIHERNAEVNKFFGVACDRVQIICANQAPDKKKRFHSIEVQSKKGWFSPKVVNDSTGFESELPPKHWKDRGLKWNASFLRNKNSVGGLFEGKINEGYYTIVTLVKDNTDELKYGTIDDKKRIENSESDFIFVKATPIEVSGLLNQGQQNQQ